MTDHSEKQFPQWRRETLLLAVVALLAAAVLTWPLVPNLFTQIPGADDNTDAPFYMWCMWRYHTQFHDWFPNPFADTDLMYRPFGVPVTFTAVIYFYCLVSAPISWLLGLIPAYNFIVLGTFITTAIAVYWLSRHLGLLPPTAAYAALFYAFSPWRVFRVTQHLNLIYTDLLVLYVLLLLVALRRHGHWRKFGIAAGLTVTAAFYCDMSSAVYISIISLVYLAFFWRPWEQRARGQAMHLAGMFTIAAGMAAVACAPVFYKIHQISQEGAMWAPSGHELYSNDLLGYLVPAGSTFWRSFFPLDFDAPILDRGTAFLGFSSIPLFVFAMLRFPKGERRFKFLFALMLLCAVLSLGPVLQAGGERVEVEIPHGTFDEPESTPLLMPFAFLHYLPVLGNLRGPERMHMLALIGYAVLAGWGLQALLRRFGALRDGAVSSKGRLAVAGLAAVALFEFAQVPFPTFRPEWEAFAAVREDPEPGLVLDEELLAASVLEHQVGHERPTVTGYIGRLSPDRRAYYRAVPLLRTFLKVYYTPTIDEMVDRYLAHPGATQHTRNALEFLDIRYFVVSEENAGKLRIFDGAVPYEQAGLHDGLGVYRVNLPPARPLLPERFVVGSLDADLYLTRGWGQGDRRNELHDGFNVAYPGSPEAVLGFRLARPMPVDFECHTYNPPDAAPVQVLLEANGHAVGEAPVPTGQGVLRFSVPARWLARGINRLAFRFVYEHGYRWNDADAAIAPRLLLSASTEGFQSGLELNGQPVHFNKPGYNLVELSEDGREMLSARAFGFGNAAGQEAELAEFVAGLPEGRLVAFMSSGVPPSALPPRALRVLGKLGSAAAEHAGAGQCHAGLGRKGMPPGEALEHFGRGPYLFLTPGRCGFSEFSLTLAEGEQ